MTLRDTWCTARTHRSRRSILRDPPYAATVLHTALHHTSSISRTTLQYPPTVSHYGIPHYVTPAVSFYGMMLRHLVYGAYA
eukprot:2774768-Rhodomonas_salina.1